VSNLIEICGDGANVALEIAKFERPNSTNVDDANWLASRPPGKGRAGRSPCSLSDLYAALKRRSSTVAQAEQEVPFGFPLGLARASAKQGRLSTPPSLALRLRAE
jgi:hypothetical protein